MKNRTEANIPLAVINPNYLDDDCVFRELARKMVTDMPITELHKLIKLSKTDPTSDHSKKVLWDEDYPQWQKEQIQSLKIDRVILYEAECDLP